MGIILKQEDLPEKYQSLFVWDGCKNLPADASRRVRSPWHDIEEKKRGKRDFLCNVWRTPIGSSDVVFDVAVLTTIKEKFIRPPDFAGEVVFDRLSSGKVDTEVIKFWPGLGQKRLKWWGQLKNGRPSQFHNYIIASDISWGLGSSNSVAEFYDVNTMEQVGEWACPNTKPEDFADLVVASAHWVGGCRKPLLIWENNGGQGVNFGNRIKWLGYSNVYVQTRENEKSRKKGKKLGWRSNTQSKPDLLQELSIALTEGIKEKKNYKAIIIHSKDLLDELFDYIFAERGKDAELSSKMDEGTGARERHGDRVIAAGLCILGTRDQQKGEGERFTSIPANSFLGRMNRWLDEQEEIQRTSKTWMY